MNVCKIERYCSPSCTYWKHEKNSVDICQKYRIPVYYNDSCRDSIDVFTPIIDINCDDTVKVVDSQKEKADLGKPRLTLVPRKILTAIARVREYGNNKYPEGGPDNWKKVAPERYRDALFRHLVAYLDDPQGVDKESGLKHLDHLACNVAFLCELEDE